MERVKDKNTTKKTARIAGWLYLLLVITGIAGFIYIPSVLVVSGNAAETANNIVSSELLFRTGIFAGLTANIIFVFLVLVLYRLLKEISHWQAILMVSLAVFASSTGFVNQFNYIAVLIILSGADFLSVFEKPLLDALAYLFIRLHSQAWHATLIFSGLWLFPFGLLVYKSRFIPKILGVLLIIAGFSYLLEFVIFLLLPQHRAAISPLITLFQVAELPVVFWLLIVGAKDQPLE